MESVLMLLRLSASTMKLERSARRLKQSVQLRQQPVDALVLVPVQDLVA
jgi:hypothetical protein